MISRVVDISRVTARPGCGDSLNIQTDIYKARKRRHVAFRRPAVQLARRGEHFMTLSIRAVLAVRKHEINQLKIH